MAEDEDGASSKKSAQNSKNGGPSNDSEQNKTDLPYFPRLQTPEAEEPTCSTSENGDASPAEAKSSSSKSTGATRKEENPFSFRHFLKRDLSLPGNSTYESTGARPKVYASTVQHSPTEPEAQAKDKSADACDRRASDNTSSSSSVDVSFSVVDNTDSKHNLYTENSDGQLYRPNMENMGMPSLPDFVQDHILVEQAYLNSNGPISVDLDNLPDFTFNTSLNGRPAARARGGGAAGAAHLRLDLTDGVGPAARRSVSPQNSFPLDLPPNAGAESMRLPDFLPVHPGRTSPEPEHEDARLRQVLAELERTRSELFAERSRRSRLEAELGGARAELAARARRDDRASRTPEGDSTVAQLKSEIQRLKEQLDAQRGSAARAAAGLRAAAAGADTSLRELLAGLEQLRTLSSQLDPT